jgi:hypothetical protein
MGSTTEGPSLSRQVRQERHADLGLSLGGCCAAQVSAAPMVTVVVTQWYRSSFGGGSGGSVCTAIDEAAMQRRREHHGGPSLSRQVSQGVCLLAAVCSVCASTRVSLQLLLDVLKVRHGEHHGWPITEQTGDAREVGCHWVVVVLH